MRKKLKIFKEAVFLNRFFICVESQTVMNIRCLLKMLQKLAVYRWYQLS